MKLSVLRFARELEVSGMAQSARFLIKASEGWDLTVTPLGVIGKHERRPEDLWVPLGNCLSGEITAEVAAQAPKPEEPVYGVEEHVARQRLGATRTLKLKAPK